jgi:hypothetical protein
MDALSPAGATGNQRLGKRENSEDGCRFTLALYSDPINYSLILC